MWYGCSKVVRVDFPVYVGYHLPPDFSEAVRSHPYRLRLVSKGEVGVAVELEVLPRDTIVQRVADGCCHGCLQGGRSTG